MTVACICCGVAMVIGGRGMAAHRLSSLSSEYESPWSAKLLRNLMFLGAVIALSAVLFAGIATALAVAIIAIYACIRIRRERRRGISQRSADHVAVALEVMIAELSIGAHPVHACRAAEADLMRLAGANEAIAVLRRMAGHAELGGDMATSVVEGEIVTAKVDTRPANIDMPTNMNAQPMADKASSINNDAEWRRVASAWRMASEYGLSIADLLVAVRDDLASRRRFRERAHSALAGARASSAVLAGLPAMGILLGQAIGAHPMAVLLGGGLGGAMLVIGIVLVVFGLEWSEYIAARSVSL